MPQCQQSSQQFSQEILHQSDSFFAAIYDSGDQLRANQSAKFDSSDPLEVSDRGSEQRCK